MQGTQDRPVILHPIETVCARSCGKDTGKGDETGIGSHQCFALSKQTFFKHADQCRLPDSAWADHEHHRPRSPDACVFAWWTDGLDDRL